LDQARISGVQRIGGQWCRSGDVGREAVRFRYLRHDVADRGDRLVRLRRSQVADWADRQRGGLGVGALGPRHGDRLAPQVLNRRHVLGVVQQSVYHLVVVLVVLLTEFAVGGFQQKDGNTGVVRFIEVVALVDRRLCRRRVAGNKRTGIFGGDVVEGRQEDVRDRSHQDPQNDDRN